MKKILFFRYALLFSVMLLPLGSCDEDGNILLFTLEDDRRLGDQVAEEIANNPDQYPILSPTNYAPAYNYLGGIINKILSAEEVSYQAEFAYDQFKIIQDDEVLNAFVTPGGYIYVYTGLIKFLQSEDHLAGVIGHEIAHAEQRHSSKALQRQLGVQFLLGIILGQQSEGAVVQVLTQLGSLSFSRDDENEADAFSVIYLADTEYSCDGAAGFFRRLEENGGQAIPEFLSTHPNSENRVNDIEAKAAEIGCSTEPSNSASYQDFIRMLP